MKQSLSLLILTFLIGSAWAKLAPPAPEEAAKAAESAARAKWTAQVGAYQLCQVQDRIAARFGSPRPAEAAAIPACVDPGPFAYTPPSEKPIEASGAHSPPGNAHSPPSTGAPSQPAAAAPKS
ncbi:MAG: hypothetical protein M9919_07425 [Burkholderiaceae bacterium]|jgi:hypothetical protein|nr:hypothetical protein [Burkholderiaceae bacterium]MCO5103821.1 hypothetical protein [Burkholderiaceae bacterium]